MNDLTICQSGTGTPQAALFIRFGSATSFHPKRTATGFATASLETTTCPVEFGLGIDELLILPAI